LDGVVNHENKNFTEEVLTRCVSMQIPIDTTVIVGIPAHLRMTKKTDDLNALLAASFRASETVSPSFSEEVEHASTMKELPPEPPVEAESSAVAELDTSPQTTKPAAKPKAKAKIMVAPEPEDLQPPDFEGVKKTTVSFYATEQAQVDMILDTLLRVRRHRGGFSDAIKIALRLCTSDPQLIGKAWDEARAADKRVQRGKGR
jgi:hypothetical protein